MKIQVEMTSDEFQEFMCWQKNKECYEEDLIATEQKLEYVNKKVLWALETDKKHPDEVKIISQEHAAELVEMATEYFA